MKKAIIIALGIITLAGQISFFAPLRAEKDPVSLLAWEDQCPVAGQVEFPFYIYYM